MRVRISRYLTERSQLFSAISHDLRTPITRLRCASSCWKTKRCKHKFGRDLDELELLVKGALQCVKDTDIHENIEPVDLNLLLECLIEPYLLPDGNGRVTVHRAGVDDPILASPWRCALHGQPDRQRAQVRQERPPA
jgi:signal transduction histidine kinase